MAKIAKPIGDKMKRNIVYTDSTDTWKIEMKDGLHYILDSKDKEVDIVVKFDEAYTLLHQHKNSFK